MNLTEAVSVAILGSRSVALSVDASTPSQTEVPAVAMADSTQREPDHRSSVERPASPQLFRGYADGRKDAEQRDMGGWAMSGLLGALGGGPIGVGIVWIFAANSGPELPPSSLMQHQTPPSRFDNDRYFDGYLRGYGDGIKRQRKSAAVHGGVVGIVSLGLLVLEAKY